ncbi:MAG TPA: preprotein translocase subunit SecG [Vicinamibacterales bacterium]|nr:preprotein translocase subunit SecG [Vicinamibacterales bacterium]
MFYAVTAFYVLVCFLLLTVVLLQRGKGGDIAAAFGGGGSQTAFGARAGASLLTRATTILAALFMLGSLALGIMWRKGEGSVVSGVGGGTPPPVQAPETPGQ